MQELKSFASKISPLDRQSSNVAAGPRETCNQSAADRVVRYRKDYGDDRCRLFYCRDGASVRDNNVCLQADKLGRELDVALGTSLRPAIFNRDSATFDPAEFTQSLHKSSGPQTPENRIHAQDADGRQFACLLCACGKRPCSCGAAKKGDKLPSTHGLPLGQECSHPTTLSNESSVVHHRKFGPLMSALGR
jgi:hypothetical protein